MNAAMIASLGLGAVKDLHEGHPLEAGKRVAVGGGLIYVSSRAPVVGQLITVGMWGYGVLSARKEIDASAVNYAEEHIGDDHPIVGGLVAAGDAMKLAVFDKGLKPLGTDIGEGAAAAYIEAKERLTSDEYTWNPLKSQWWSDFWEPTDWDAMLRKQGSD